MLQRPSQRVAVFIDTQNMYHSAKHLYSSRVNFPALVQAAVGNRELVRAIAYVAKSKTGEETAFFEALTSNGIELKVKDVQEFASGEKKADWDVGMAVDAMAISPRVDVIVLVTGDGDFIPLVNYLKAMGIVCEAVAFGPSTNNHLREAVDGFIDLNENPDQFLLHNRHHSNTAIKNKKAAPSLESVFEPLHLDGISDSPSSPNPIPDSSDPLPKPTRGRKPLRSSTLSPDEEPPAPSSPTGRSIRVTF